MYAVSFESIRENDRRDWRLWRPDFESVATVAGSLTVQWPIKTGSSLFGIDYVGINIP